MEIKKPTYEELEIEVNKLRKLQESNMHSNNAINFHHASMNSINNAIHTAANIDEMMSNVLQAILDLFSVERAWLLSPCDPNATSWAVPMERTKPGYEGAHALGKEIPMLPQYVEFFKRIQHSHDVVSYDYIQNPEEISDRFSVLSDMHMSLYPKTGKTWVFGVHQCTHVRVWTENEKTVFKEIGNRVSDALNSFLFLKGLKASESKFKAMSEISPLAIYMTSGIEQKAEYINPIFVELFGYTLEEVPTVDKWWPLAYPNEEYRNKLVAEWQEKVEHAINTKSEIEPMETVVTCKDGSVKNIIWGYISTDIQNWAFGLDVTEQKQAEESFRTSKDALDNLTNSLTDIVFSVKMPQRVIEWCNNSIRAIEYEPAEIIGQTTAFLFSDEENYLAFGNRLYQSLEDGNAVFETEQLFKKKNGEIFSANVRVTCDKENGEIVRATSIIRDITEQKQINYRLQESEEKYRALFDNAPLSYQSLDKDGRFIDINPSWLRTLGYERNEVIGKFYADFLHPDWKPHFEKNFPAFKKRGYVNGVEFKIRHKKGHFIHIGFEGCIGYLPDGSFKQTYCVFQDITEKKKAENELIKTKEEAEHNELQFKQLVENIADAIFIADTETGFILNVNQAAERLMLMSKNEIIGLHQSKLHPQYSEEYSKKTFRDDSQTKTELRDTIFVENKILRKDGVEVPIEILSSKVKYKGKECLIGTFRDVSERKKTELQLKTTEENLKNTFDLSPSIIAKANMNEGRFTQVNKAITKILGYSIDEFTARPYMEFVHPDDIQSTIDIATEQLKGNDVTFFENRYLCKDGSYKWIAWHGTKPDDDGIVTTIGSDINERKQSEIQLIESEEKYRTMIETSNDLIWMLDHKGNFTFLNAHAEKATGYLLNDLKGKSLLPLVMENELSFLKEVFAKAMLGESISYEMNLKTVYGNTLTLAVNTAPLSTDDGIKAMYSFARDITESKSNKIALEKSEKLLNLTGKIAKVGGWEINVELQTLNWTKETYLIHEVSSNFQPTVEDAINFYTEDSKIRIEKAVNESIIKGKSFNLDLSIITAKGNIKIVNAIGQIQRNSKGETTHILGIFQDITDQKKAEKALIESEERLNEAQRMASIGHWIQDIPSGKLKWSDETFQIFEVDKEFSGELIDAFITTIHPEDREAVTNAYKNSLETKKPYEITHRLQMPDGQIKYVHKRCETAYDKSGNPVKSIGTVQDVTKLKRAEKQLIKAKEKAEESDRLKSAFLANMSHEIRTPMNGILGFSELLKSPKLSGDQQQKYIGIIEKSGNRMLNIINDIIDISKIEAGLMKLDITESDINEQLEYIYTFFKPEVEAKGMKLSLRNTLPSKETIIKTDREKVFAVLTNLVKNAIKYSNKGLIEIGYHKKGASLEFFVKDTGIGIPKDRQKNIFERFIQVDVEDKMARQGAGLGLAISKAYVEILGGSIWIESEEGIGSTFYFTLPYNAELKEKSSAKDIEDSNSSENHIKNLKILIVEDDETSEMLLSINVSEFSDEIITARTGIEAIEACHNNPDIDLIMMDIQMPEMNGYEATHQIRKFNKDVVIIAQTAYGLSGDKEKVIKAGCNDYISKPIKQDELFVLIQKYFKKS